tara:strand:+ start:8002 stop:8118 length:117 start_codon:yes stop_codon:yes gene_type:complete
VPAFFLSCLGGSERPGKAVGVLLLFLSCLGGSELTDRD